VLTTRSTHRATIVAVLACMLLAIAAPAGAAPPPDMHASFAEAAAKAQQQQDLRSADARDAALKTTTKPPLPGPPTWPVNPEPIAPAPVVQATGDGGLDWTTIALGLGGSLLVLGGIAGVVLHSRRVGRGQVAA
jgi:hypothetical protein